MYILNSLSIACYLLTACIAATIPAHYGRQTPDKDITQPFLSDSSSSPSSPRLFDSLTEDNLSFPNPKVLFPLPRLSPALTRNAQSSRSLPSLLLKSLSTSATTLLTLLSVPNPTFTVLLVALLYALFARIEILLPQYTSLALNWPLATVNAVLALKALISALILFLLPLFRTRVLAPRYNHAAGPDNGDATTAIDLLIVKTSLASNFIGLVGIIGSTGHPGLFISSLCVYTAGVVIYDSLTSYGVQTLAAGEDISQFYIRIGVVNTIAALAGAPLWSGAFRGVLRSGWLGGKGVE